MCDAKLKTIDINLQRFSFTGVDVPVQTVEDLLTASPVDDEILHSQQAEMMAHGRLRQREFLAESGDIALAAAEQQKNVQTSFIGE